MTVLYFFADPKTMYDCAKFLCTVQFVMCCNSFYQHDGNFLLNKWTRLYSLIFGSIVISGLTLSMYLLLYDPATREIILNLDNLVLSIFGLELIMSSFVFIVSVVSLQAAAREHFGIYERIDAIDQLLMLHFGATLNYRKLMRKNIIILSSVAFIYILALTLAAVEIQLGNIYLVLLATWCYKIVTGGPHFNGYIHMNLSEILYIRFRLLQKIINREFLMWKFPERSLREARLSEAVEIVKELHFMVRDINKIYKFSLLTSMTHDFTLSTSELYILIGRTLDSETTNYKLVTYVLLIMVPPFYKMLVAPVYCDRTIAEGRKCLRLIEMLDCWFAECEFIKELVGTMMRWRMEHKIEFQSGMNIVLNRTVISMFTSVVFNYLLILIQFHMTQKMGAQIEQQKVALQEWIGL